MWVEYMKAKSLVVAEMWKEALEGEGLPIRLLPEEALENWGEKIVYRIMVPRGREHVADEIIRKL